MIRGAPPWLVLAPVVLGLACASGPQVPDRPLLPDQQFAQRVFKLTSGLQVLVQEDHRAPLVAVTTVVGAGASADPNGQEGLAHLVEHLSHRKVAGRLKRTGATYNAMTESDRTTFFALAHRDQLQELVAIEGLRLEGPLQGVAADVFDTERDVVRNEQRQRGGDPRAVAELFKRVFPGGHPMARGFPAGPPDLAAVTLASAQQFVARHYRPANISVVIAGDVDPEQVALLLDRWSPSLISEKAGPGPAAASPAPASARPVAAPEIHRVSLSVPTRILFIAWPVPANRRPHDPFLAMTLGALVIKLQLGGWVSRQAAPLLLESQAGSLFAVALALDPEDDALRVRERVLDDVASSRGDLIARRLMGRVKWLTGTTIMRNSTDLLASSIAVAHYFAATGRPSFYKDTLQQIAAVDPLEVSDFVWANLARDRAVSLLLEPDRRLGQDEEVSAAAITGIDPTKHELSQNDAVNLAELGTEQLQRMVRVPGLTNLPRFRLSNGLEVVVVPRATGIPVAELVVQLPLGNEGMAPFGLAGMADELSRTPRDCLEESLLDEVGGTIAEQGGDWPRKYSVQVFAGNLANGFVALSNSLRCRELVSDAMKRAGEVLRVRAEVKQNLARKPYHQAVEAFWTALYPDGAFGLRNRDVTALQALAEGDYQAALRAQYQPAGALAVVVTDRPTGELQPLMQSHLGDWTESPPPRVRPAQAAAALPPARSVRLFQAEAQQQDLVRFGCRLPPVTEATLPAYDLLEAIVSREANQVRTSWGATYGFDVEVLYRPHGVAHLKVQGSVEPTRTADAIARLLKFVAGLASAGPDIKSFLTERWDLGRTFNRRFATGSGLAEGVLQAAQLGWSPAAWDAYPENLAQLSRGAIRDLLIPCAGHEVVTVVGDKGKLAGQLAALGITQ